MILVDSNVGLEYKFDCHCLNAIVVEEAHYYEIFVQKIYKQINKIEETLLLYNEHNDLVEMNKKCAEFFSPVDLSFQNTKFQKKFLIYLSDKIEMSDRKDELLRNNEEKLCLMDDIRDISDYNFYYEDQYSVMDILKGLNVKLEDPVGSFVEKFMECASVYRDFLGANIFFLVGCAGFISEDDFAHLQKWANYQEIFCVFIECSDCRIPDGVKKFVVDKDLCMIY